jgi:FlaA1/EpsC-like NDP-sugar epimerase
MQKLIIIGASGFGREIAWLVERINRVKPTWELLGFVDDNEKLHGNIIGGYPVISSCNWLSMQQNVIFAVCAVGSSRLRRKIIIWS